MSNKPPISRIPGPETDTGWIVAGTRSMDLPVELTADDRESKIALAADVRATAQARLDKANKAKAAAAKEFTAAQSAKRDADAVGAGLDREIQSWRFMREGTVRRMQFFPSDGQPPRERLVRLDEGYEGFCHGDEREMTDPAEWCQAEMAGLDAVAPTAQFLDVVREAVELGRVALGPDADSESLIKFVKSKGIEASDADIGAVCLSILIQHAAVELCGLVEQSVESLASDVAVAVPLVDEVMARAVIDDMIGARLYIADGVVMLTGSDAPPIDDTPANGPDVGADDEPAANPYAVHKWLSTAKGAQSLTATWNAAKEEGVQMARKEFKAWLAQVISDGAITEESGVYTVTCSIGGKYSVIHEPG